MNLDQKKQYTIVFETYSYIVVVGMCNFLKSFYLIQGVFIHIITKNINRLGQKHEIKVTLIKCHEINESRKFHVIRSIRVLEMSV